MHVLSTPPAFVLSQDQTLRRDLSDTEAPQRSESPPRMAIRGELAPRRTDYVSSVDLVRNCFDERPRPGQSPRRGRPHSLLTFLWSVFKERRGTRLPGERWCRPGRGGCIRSVTGPSPGRRATLQALRRLSTSAGGGVTATGSPTIAPRQPDATAFTRTYVRLPLRRRRCPPSRTSAPVTWASAPSRRRLFT